MPAYFGQFEIVAQTPNFIVTCVDDAEARARAQNVAVTCEADLVRLNDLFSTNFEAGNTSPHGIWVNVLKDLPSSGSNGWNYGYETSRSSRIVLQRAFVPPLPSPPPADPPATPPPNFNAAVIEFPRFVFVAELAEILMDFSGNGWGRGDSMGEGLSIVLATLLHPVGYYDASGGPRINQWLNGGGGPPVNPPRAAMRITTTEDSDRNIFSYGCAILFLNYLVYQLGHSMKDVIRAAGPTLAECYARLTGQPAASATGAFDTLLQNHIGKTTSNNLRRDNIFPLFDPKLRHVELNPGDLIDKGQFTDPVPVMFDVKPGIACPAGSFGFLRQHQQVEQLVYARVSGTANASFRWSIEGVDIPVRGTWTNFTVNNPVKVKNPDGKTQIIANALTFQYAIADAWNGSVLYLKTLSTDGNCSIDVSVAAREAALKDAEVSTSYQVSLITVVWLPGEEIKKARKRCNPFYGTVDTTLWGLSAKLSDAKNRPDPPSERALADIANAVHHVDAAVEQFAKAGHTTTEDVWHQIRTGALKSMDAPAAPPDLTQLPEPVVKTRIHGGRPIKRIERKK